MGKDPAVDLMLEFVRISDGKPQADVVLACANLIGQLYVQNSPSLEVAEAAVDAMSTELKRWLRVSWMATHDRR
jgi:hypothetical protein